MNDRLPHSPDLESDRPRGASPATMVSPATGSHRVAITSQQIHRRVLLALEDGVSAKALQEELEKRDCCVQRVGTAREAEQLLMAGLSEQPWQLIIMDARLPDRAAHEFLAQLHQAMAADRPPVVLTMGFGYDPQCRVVNYRELLGPRDSILYVPFRRDQLEQVVHRAFG